MSCPTMAATLKSNVLELAELLTRLKGLAAPTDKLVDAMLACWKGGGKVLIAGNGGSAADAMHFAEELLVRFHRNRMALAAIALCDPTTLTCAGNDFGFDHVFSRQVQGLGRQGDLLIVMSTSGNSRNLLMAVQTAKKLGMTTAAFLGKDGGALRSACDVELLVPCEITHHIQEVHQLVFHAVCQWIDSQVE